MLGFQEKESLNRISNRKTLIDDPIDRNSYDKHKKNLEFLFALAEIY